MQNFKFFFITLSIITHISLIQSNATIDHSYPEMSDEEYLKFQKRFILEENESEKQYLELVIKPEKFDLNKDRKISKAEIVKAITYAIMPKDKKKMKTIPDYLQENLKNNIELFVKHIELDFLNFKQFQYLMRNVNAIQFLNVESLESTSRARGESRLEGESEL